MTYNQAIMELISDDRYIQRVAFDALRQKWSQLNENTRIQFVNHHTVYINTPRDVPAPRYTTKLVPQPGWETLKFLAIGRGFGATVDYSELEDPEKRWSYSVRLAKAVVNAPRYVFWRTVGRIFKRPDWTAKGMVRVPDYDAYVNYAPVHREEIRLEHFRYVSEIDRRLPRPPWQEQEYCDFYCGYHAASDTLYVWRR